MANIERRSGLSFKMFMDEYIIPNRPVILTDASKDWKAYQFFTPDFFKKNFPEKRPPLKAKNIY